MQKKYTLFRPSRLSIAMLWALTSTSTLLTVSLPQTSYAQGDKSTSASQTQIQNIDLLTLYREAAVNDPVFNAAKQSYLAGKEKLWQGLSVLLPQVNATGSETKGSYDSNSAHNGNLKNRGWTVKLTQPLLNWDKWEQFRQGDLNRSIAEAQYAVAEQELILRVTEAYFNLLNAQDTLNLTKNKKVLIGEQLEQAKRNFEVGTATITDTHEAQSRYDLVVAQELAAEADLVIKRGALEQLTGQQVPNQLKTLMPEAKIETVAQERKVKVRNQRSRPVNVEKAVAVQTGQSMNDWVKQAEDVSYAVIAARLSYDVAVKDTSRAYAGHAPYVDLIAQRGYTDSESYSSSTLSSSKYYANQIGVQVTIPLFAGGYTQSVVREKSALANKALADLENTKRTVAQNTRQAYLGFNSGLAQVKAYEAAEVSALSALESNKLGYEVGVRINIDVLNAQDTLFTTRRDLAKARYDTILNGLKLKAQAAVLSDDDLMIVNNLLK